jgi:hypothetical protein
MRVDVATPRSPVKYSKVMNSRNRRGDTTSVRPPTRRWAGNSEPKMTRFMAGMVSTMGMVHEVKIPSLGRVAATATSTMTLTRP